MANSDCQNFDLTFHFVIPTSIERQYSIFLEVSHETCLDQRFHEHKKYLKEFTSIQAEATSNLHNIYLFVVNNRNTRKWCDIRSKLMIKSPERRQWRLSGVFIVNFKHISHLFLEFLLLTMNKQILTGHVLLVILESCSENANQWPGFYMIAPLIVNGLKAECQFLTV